jgi:hypothetical protein
MASIPIPMLTEVVEAPSSNPPNLIPAPPLDMLAGEVAASAAIELAEPSGIATSATVQDSTSSEDDDSDILAEAAIIQNSNKKDNSPRADAPDSSADTALNSEARLAEHPDITIERLRSEILASAARFNDLQQNLRDSTAKEHKEFLEIPYAFEDSDQGKIVTKATSSLNVALVSKNSKEKVFIASVNQNTQGDAQEEEHIFLSSEGEQEESSGPSDSAAKRKSPAAPTSAKAKASAKKKPVDNVKRPVSDGKDAEKVDPRDATSPNTGVGAGVCRNRIFSPAEAASALKRAKETGANVPLPPQPPMISAAVRGTPSHDDNVAALLKYWPHTDVVAALAQTMSEEGSEDLQAAYEHLVQQRNRRISRAASEKKKEQQLDLIDEDETIRADGELAAILGGAPGAMDTVLFLVDLHQRIRNGHSAEFGRTAANLMGHRQVQSAKHLKAVSSHLMQKIAQAVIHDCRDCEGLRVKAKAAKDEAVKSLKAAEERKSREQAAKAAEEERKRRAETERKEREEREEQRNRQAATPPLDELDDEGEHSHHDSHSDPSDAFDPGDSKWAKRRKAELCWNCGQGDLGGSKQHLYICDVCENCLHKPCTKWSKVIRSSTARGSANYKFGCRNCCRVLPPAWKMYIEEEEDRPTPPTHRQIQGSNRSN